ncbi:MAG TPA: ATP-binding cassette domain-containing protein, partial [Rhodothermales bacterium]
MPIPDSSHAPAHVPVQPAAPLLSARDLTRHYPSGNTVLEVLRGVSLDVRRGEVVAVVGESGTGKSTLLHLLGALDRPTSGTVHFEGDDVFKKD